VNEELAEQIFDTTDKSSFERKLLKDEQDLSVWEMLMVYFGTPNMFITLWIELDYGTNIPLVTLMT
jgi:hypothetical protein